MEYIFTNLPQYIKVTPRSEFSNSVVHNGSVLLFSEDGTSLTAKLPDGSFVTIGGGPAPAEHISSGGTGTDTAIKWNGYLTVSSGGTVKNTKVISGSMAVSDGGIASDTFMLTGSMAVSNGGTATNTRILGGSAVFSGGIADGAQIEYGGYMRLSSGVSGNNILIHSGGRLDIYNPGTGAVVTSVTVSGIFDIWGGASADHVHVCSGGIMYQREGAIVTNLVVDEGGEVQ